jgi:glutamate-1-semialdehyde 2,1-aminomutase
MTSTNNLSAATLNRSERLAQRARRVLAGGGNSNMRVLPYHLPLFVARGEGCRFWDVDGNEYIDLNMGYGPLIFGHRPRRVIEAAVRQISEDGIQFGFPAELSIRVGEKVRKLFPGMELMRFSSTGTEAVASAIRLARTATGRKKLIAFEGHYHGWSDAVFHRYHAPLEELPAGDYGSAIPGTLGMNGAPHDVLVVRWNDLTALERCFADQAGDVAAVIMEPIMANAGVIPPDPQYLAGARELAHDQGALLIFDEVITGLRVGAGGAQQLYHVYPDITVISKALGAGFPISAFGASRDLMDVIAKGCLFHGGVYSGSALAMSAAEAVLDEVLARGEELYAHLYSLGDRLSRGVQEIMTRLGVHHRVQHVGPLISIFATTRDVDALRDYRSVRRCCDLERYIAFQHHLQRSGVYFHPNQFEPLFLSTAHSMPDIETVLERIEDGARCCLAK